MALRALRWLQHKDCFALSGCGFHHGATGSAANFFVRIEQNRYRTVCGPSFFQRAHGKNHHGNPGLHVINARTVSATVLNAERHLCQRTHGPYGVEVSQQKCRLAGAARKFGLQVVSCFFLRIEGDFAAHALKYLCQQSAHTVKRGFVVAGRFNFHHAPQEGHHFSLMLLAEGEVGKSGLAGGFGHTHICMINAHSFFPMFRSVLSVFISGEVLSISPMSGCPDVSDVPITRSCSPCPPPGSSHFIPVHPRLAWVSAIFLCVPSCPLRSTVLFFRLHAMSAITCDPGDGYPLPPGIPRHSTPLTPHVTPLPRQACRLLHATSPHRDPTNDTRWVVTSPLPLPGFFLRVSVPPW